MAHAPQDQHDGRAARPGERHRAARHVHGQTLLHAASITIEAGKRISITGPSGSGKSVFMRALALLDPLDGGEVQWRGKSIARAAIPRVTSRISVSGPRCSTAPSSARRFL
ncbi:ATP-binding cassette domain-containing protein [Paraburkholderia sp. SIMBA_054]|uniref:ATP-binding cassette domain-containing protein n=1 Tax=Paraburkholderia sp. SIMBA_054 TaxID=3085795 RepID=UPI00397B6539